MLEDLQSLTISASSDLMPSAAERVFGIMELSEPILILATNIPGGYKRPFALQRVSTAFRDTILGSKVLRHRMLLEHKNEPAPNLPRTTIETLLSAQQLTFLPFERIKVDAREPSMAEFAFGLNVGDERDPTAASALHMRAENVRNPSASWRHMKLSWHAVPICIRFYINVEGQDKSRSSYRDVYFEWLEFAEGQGSLGDVADRMDLILARTADDYRQRGKLAPRETPEWCQSPVRWSEMER